MNPGYADAADRPYKRGFYDVINQQKANDFCRYVGDPMYFACQLSDKSDVYAKTYKGKPVTEIIQSQTPSVPADLPDSIPPPPPPSPPVNTWCTPGTVVEDNNCFLKVWKEVCQGFPSGGTLSMGSSSGFTYEVAKDIASRSRECVKL